ncbi:hypothetical protein [Oceanobacillus sp. FSL W7-1293]|uniref:hypothetical protein n=1 Tax=Oceanobacillus sp. FSL W7-1293 TaxID=2921699 RepID=UPI0030CE362A
MNGGENKNGNLEIKPFPFSFPTKSYYQAAVPGTFSPVSNLTCGLKCGISIS